MATPPPRVWGPRLPPDGQLDEVYAACGQYQRPILLHVEPPESPVLDVLLQAAAAHPQTRFVFARANAFTTPERRERLLSAAPNLYVDFHAGSTVVGPESHHTLVEFVPPVEKFADRVVISSDSGSRIDVVSPASREWIARRTVESILPP